MDVQGSSLSLFQPPPVEKTIEKEEWIEYRPIGQISQGSTIEFNIPQNSTNYIDLKKTRLYIKAKIVKPDGKAAVEDEKEDKEDAEEDKVAFVNLTLHALFRQVDVNLQQKCISPDVSVSYPYKAMLDVLLHTGHDVKESQLQTELYYKDSSGAMDATDPMTGGNGGLLERYTLTMDGLEVSMEGPIHMDICQQSRAILNGVQITVKLYPSSDDFRLMAGDKVLYRVAITDAVLKVCNVKVYPDVMIAHNDALKLGEALYPISQSKVKTATIPKGSFTHTIDGLFNGDVPSSLVVGLVSSEAYAGSYAKNYANFKHFNLNYLSFSSDGNSIPAAPFQPDYVSGEYTAEFLSLFLNHYPQHAGNFITREDYPFGYCIYVFNIIQH